jgi:uncharacterized protein YgbK (DUF1537 family)
VKLVFYGDDFTGATDTLGTFARAGLHVLLLPQVPTVAQLEALGGLDALGVLDVLGIAGAARSMTPEAMRAELEPLGRLFAALGAPLLHYKTCSTFDSAPQLGSIGHAVSVLRPFAGNPLVAIVGGQPNLGRYCLFGHLFAALRTGGEVYRLDRHPTMREHPATPMHEADLRLHLREQGLANVVNIAYPAYEQPLEQQQALLERTLADEQPDAVLFDIGERAHLAAVGRIVWPRAQQAPLLAVGSSGVAQALLAAWGADEPSSRAEPARIAPAAGPVFVLAGSLSPVTARQIDAAVSYQHVRVDAARLLARDAAYRDALLEQIGARLRNGRHVLAATAGADARIGEGTAGAALAHECGALLSALLRRVPLKRIGIAGGDTSSHALRSLGLNALGYLGELAPGVVMCRARAGDPALDGLELMLKGGQVGGDDLFERLLRGG